jgi:hypothetical protein
VFRIDDQAGSVDVKLRTKEGGLLITVSAKGCSEKTADGKPFPLELDMSDLKATTIELAKDSNGRKFLLSLTPSVQISPKPKPLQLTGELLDLWRLSFLGSRIILNDEKYLGIFEASGGELAFLQIPGIGKVEFSLKPFKNAEVLGQLDDSTIRIETPEGSKLEITNVTCGQFTNPLPGGPYMVWTRVTSSGMTFEQEIQSNLRQFEEGIKTSDIDLGPEQVEKARERISKGYGVALGVSGIPQQDRIEEEN